MTVLEIKGSKVTVQSEDGSKFIVPLQECLGAGASHGGARSHAGRPPKQGRENWGQITCVLRKDTIDRLREGSANGRFFGEFLQFHLDRFPLPSHAQYLSLKRYGFKPDARPARVRPLARTKEELSRDEKQLPYLERLKLLIDRSGDQDKVAQDDYAQRIANLRARGLTREQIQKRLGLSRRQLAQHIDPSVKPQATFTKEVV